MTQFYDRAEITGQARITPEGYFVADALVARANNIQTYTAGELGLADRDPSEVIRVFRPEAEVFAADSLASATRLPITLDHPVKDGRAIFVDATNWREFTRGQSDDQVLRDGEYIRVPLRITDASTVDAARTTHQEFSLGYGANIRMEPGEYGGQAYDAIAADFRYNHLAACRAARGGPELRIIDERTTLQGAPKMPKIVLVDGLPVDISDATVAEGTINKLLADRATAQADATDTKALLSTANTTIAARDAEIVTLKDAVAAAVVTPAALRDAAASYARTTTLAKALGATVTDAMDEPAVRKAAVAHKMGDAAKDYDDNQVSAAFDALTAGLPANQALPPVADGLRTVISSGVQSVGDAMTGRVTAHDARMRRYETAHLGASASTNNGAAAQ
jgi:uncharacterized protein